MRRQQPYAVHGTQNTKTQAKKSQQKANQKQSKHNVHVSSKAAKHNVCLIVQKEHTQHARTLCE